MASLKCVVGVSVTLESRGRLHLVGPEMLLLRMSRFLATCNAEDLSLLIRKYNMLYSLFAPKQ